MNRDIRQLYSLFLRHPNVSTDSRKIGKDTIFFALKGETFDGSKFAGEALRQGAVCAVVDDPSLRGNNKCLVVDDVLTTLQALALHHRRQLMCKVIAITGTNGKTTTKELLRRVLANRFTCSATQGNLNNHIGVPLTLLSLAPETEMAVIEMGANHRGEIASLCRIAEPDYGLITNIGKAHLEGFGSYEGVIKAKSELYLYLQPAKGTVFVNTGHQILDALSRNMKRVTYAFNDTADCRGYILKTDPCIELRYAWGRVSDSVSVPLPGAYNAENILSAICTGVFFGVDKELIRQALESYRPVNNRSQLVRTAHNEIILDAYNANPSSMKASIGSFSGRQTNKPRMLILGEMHELGDAAAEEHENLVRYIAGLVIDEVILIGNGFASTSGKSGFTWLDSTEKAADWIRIHQPRDRMILIKGSRKNKLEELLVLL
jgi:UDP-N-acetylmuramoyl-tripeptide--D-alanyl-D-alanine ligase